MNSQIMQYMPYIVGGVFALLALIIIPIVLRKTKKKRQEAADLGPEIARRTGLNQTAKGFEGNYKGYPVVMNFRMGTNAMDLVSSVTYGSTNIQGRRAFFPVINIELSNNDGGSFPAIHMYEKTKAVFDPKQKMMDKMGGKEPTWPKLDVETGSFNKRVKFYGDDPSVAQKFLSYPELQTAISDWNFTDVKLQGDKVLFELNNSDLMNRVGYKKYSEPEFFIQALDITVASANAAKS